MPDIYSKAGADAQLATKVPTTRTVAGKALSANVSLVKADVGLDQADNTSDAAKITTYGLFHTIFYTGSAWPARTLPTGYTGRVFWDSGDYVGAPEPPAAVVGDRWGRRIA